MNVPPRYRLPIAILASVGVVVVVLVAVLLAGGGGPSRDADAERDHASASPDPTSTPEGAVRAFFEAFAQGAQDGRSVARRAVRHEQAVIRIPVGRRIPAGTEGRRKGVSVTTVQRLDELQRSTSPAVTPPSPSTTRGRLRHRPRTPASRWRARRRPADHRDSRASASRSTADGWSTRSSRSSERAGSWRARRLGLASGASCSSATGAARTTRA